MKNTIKFLITIIAMVFVLLSASTALAKDGDCYVLIEKAGNFNPNIVLTSTISIIGQYVENVKMPPSGGLRSKDCRYSVALSESMEGFFLSISGRKINSIGNSILPGMKGFTQSLLRAIYRTTDDAKKRKNICEKYRDLMIKDCQPVETIVMLFDQEGRPITNNSSVREGDRFNFLIHPSAELYAYVVSKDTNGNMFNIFPNSGVTNTQNPLKGGIDYYLPPQNSDLIFEFDNHPGEEKLFFLFSTTPMNDPNEFFKKVAALNFMRDKHAGKLTRGIGLVKSKTKVKINLKNKYLQKDSALAELVKGTGMIIQTITLNHLP